MKRLRLIFTTLSLCIAVGLMAFGVYSATNVTANISGTIQYQVTDAFVDIRTKVYKSETYLNSAEIGQYVNDLADADFNTIPDGLKFHSESGTFSSTPEEENDYIYDLQDLSFVTKTNPAYTYFFVVNIVNKSENVNVWSIMDDSAFDYFSNPYDDDIDDEETALLEIENTVQINNGAQTHIDTNGKNMVIALGLDNYAKNIEQKSFNYQINIGTGDLATQDFNLAKISIDGDTVSANGSPKGVVVLPTAYEDVEITTVAEYGFTELYQLSTVVIPEGITTIGSEAFNCCCSLTTLVVPSTVENLGDGYNFYSCYNMTYLEYNAISVGEEYLEFVFSCIGMDTNAGAIIKIGEGVEVIAESLFSFEEKGLSDKVYGLEIPSTVEYIGEDAFGGCSSQLQYIEVHPDNQFYSDLGGNNVVYDIENEAILLGCSNSVLPQDAAIATIGVWAFVYCDMESITLPDSVTTIQDNAFYASKLKSVTFGESLETTGYASFGYCENLTEIVLPESITTISWYSFVECINLTNVTIGSNIETIGENAFSGCNNIKTMKIYAETAPTLEGTHEDTVPTSIEKIYIPVGSLDSYEETWGTEYNFVEIETDEITNGDWTYKLNENYDGFVITKYHGEETEVEIPNQLEYPGIILFNSNAKGFTLNTYSETTMLPVTGIMGSLDDDCSIFENVSNTVTKVTLPETLKTIGEASFMYCRDLSDVNIPSGVTEIGWAAFSECYALTSEINLGNVEKIEGYAFSDCEELTYIAFGNKLKTIGDYAFTNCTNLENITLPQGLKEIGEGAFDYSALTSVTIPASVTAIGTNPFGNCNMISITVDDLNKNFTDNDNNCIIDKNSKTLIAGASSTIISTDSNLVTKIGNEAFISNKNLTSIFIPENITEIGNSAFSRCENLKTLTIGENVEEIGDGAFSSCTVLENIIIPDSVITIGSGAFSNCNNAQSIIIGNNVETIDVNAFYNCSNVQTLTIGEKIATVSSDIFSNLKKLTEINFNAMAMNDFTSTQFRNAGSEADGIVLNIGKNVTKIPNYLFNGCQKILEINFAQNSLCERIGNYAFKGTYVTELIIPDSVTYVGTSAFEDATSLNTLTIGKGVTSIGYDVFNNTSALAEVNFNAINVTDTGYRIFASAGTAGDGITLNIGAEVTKIPDYLFWYQTGTIYTPPVSSKPIESYAAPTAVAPKLTSIVFPSNSVCKSIGKYAFSYCSDITSLVLPESVEQIYLRAFQYCTNLKTIDAPGVVRLHQESINQCTSLTDINYPNIKYIGPYVFGGNSRQNINLPEGLLWIGDSAFNHSVSSSNTSITIPSTVVQIGGMNYKGDNNTNNILGTHIFYDCAVETLTEFIVAEGNPYFVTHEGVLYTKDYKYLVAYPAAKTAESYVMPEGCVNLFVLSFSRAFNLKSLTLPNSLIVENEITSNDIIWVNLASAIYRYTSIEEIKVKDNNENYTAIDGMLYTKDGTELLYCPSRKYFGETLVFADSCTTLDLISFCYGNDKLSYGGQTNVVGGGPSVIYIGENITTISDEMLKAINGEDGETVYVKWTIQVSENSQYFEVVNGKLVRKTA